MYYYGIGGFIRDSEVAVSWYRRSAAQGYVTGQLNLGRSYRFGRGVAKDDEKAFMYFQRVAEQDHYLGSYWLGLSYLEGRGVQKSIDEGLRWMRRSAELGFFKAQERLARIYDEGILVPPNKVEALNWYRKAGEQGYIDAILDTGFLLANKYLEGHKPDYVAAYRWLYLASSCPGQGNDEFERLVEAEITPQQAKEARNWAIQWLKDFRQRKQQNEWKKLITPFAMDENSARRCR